MDQIVNVPFPSGLGDQLNEVPQAPTSYQTVCRRISLRHPLRCQTHHGHRTLLLALGYEDDALFDEALVRVLEGFFVHGFEV